MQIFVKSIEDRHIICFHERPNSVALNFGATRYCGMELSSFLRSTSKVFHQWVQNPMKVLDVVIGNNVIIMVTSLDCRLQMRTVLFPALFIRSC